MEAAGAYEPLVELAEGLRVGATELPQYLGELAARFAAVEPAVSAFLPEEGRFERLHSDAEELLARYPEPSGRPPLFGVPVGVKDIFHVAGFPTLAGAAPPPDVPQAPEADSVRRLKAAGALILGKTVTTEFAYFGPGPTRNPHNPDHTPGGSSSGSAAAVAAGLSSLTLGTQTIGSVNRPAAFCGVVGFKPSYGRIPRVGVIPLAPSVDHVGFFTTDVNGAQLAAATLCDLWEPLPSADRPVLGVPEGPYLQQAERVGTLHLERILQQLESQGFVIRPVPVMEDFKEIRQAHETIVAGEAAQVHEAWFAAYRERYHPRTLELIQGGRKIGDEELLRALDSRHRLRARLTRQMDDNDLDLWIGPAAPGPAPEGLASTGDPVMNLPWTHSGLPSLTLPVGRDSNRLPLGIQLVGRWYGDEELLAQSQRVEAALASLQGAETVQAMPAGRSGGG